MQRIVKGLFLLAMLPIAAMAVSTIGPQPSTPVNVQIAPAGSNVNISSVSLTSGSSVLVFAANAQRRGIECRTLTTNTDSVFISFGVAAVNTDFPMGIDSYWSMPYAGISTQTVNAIALSGTQVLRCREVW